MSKKLIVAVILLNKYNQILMEINNSYSKCKNLWQFPGGKVEIGEPLKVAAIRELSEELDITVYEEDLKELTFNSYLRFNKQYIIFYYICNKWEGKVKNNENQTIEWFDLNNISKNKIIPYNHNVISYLNNFLETNYKNT